MGQLLDWYSKYNSTIIQTLAVLIGLLLCFFIFRIFFSVKPVVNENQFSNQKSKISTENIDNKVNEILESENKRNLASGDKSSESSELVEKLQVEIYNLKQTLKEQTTVSAAEPQAATGASQESTEYIKQIEDLKNRLSDYEVIADDIADLKKIRDENKMLQAQLASLGISVPIPDSTAEDKDASQNIIPDLTDDQNVVENTEVTEQDKELIEQFAKQKGS